MYLFDYSLDNLSLMALTLSVGFVVDDAIVMLKTSSGTWRWREADGSALNGSKENRLHDHLDDDLAGCRLHPHPLHGRHSRAALHEFRGDESDPRFSSPASSRLTLTPLLSAKFLRAHKNEKHGKVLSWPRRRCSTHARRLRARSALRTAASAPDPGSVAGHPGRDRLALHRRAQGLHPE